MTISRISDEINPGSVTQFIASRTTALKRNCYNHFGDFIGLALEEENDQWMFIPVGSELWYDDESDTFVTRLPKSEPDECVSKMRENVGTLL